MWEGCYMWCFVELNRDLVLLKILWCVLKIINTLTLFFLGHGEITL